MQSLNKVIPIDIKASALIWMISAGVITLSALLLVAFGIKAWAILGLILFLYAIIRFQLFSLCFLFLTATPVTILFSGIKSIFIYSVALLIICTWLIRKLITRNAKIEYSIQLIFFALAFLGVASFSVLHNELTASGFVGFIKLIIFFVLICIIYDLYQPRYTFILMFSIIAPILIFSLLLFAKFAGTKSLVSILLLYRNKATPFGWPVNINAFAADMVMVLPFCWALFIWSKKRWLRFVSGIISVALTLSLFITAARAALAGFALTTVFFFIWARKTRYFIVIIVVVLSILALYPNILTLFSLAFRVEGGTTGRDIVWADTGTLILQNFWFGIGIRNFQEVYTREFAFIHWRNRLIPHDAHNQVLDWVVRLGIMGLPLILILYYFSIKSGMNVLGKVKNREDKGIIYGIFGGIIAVCGRSLFESGAMLLAGVYLFPAIIYWTMLIMLMKLDALDKLPEKGLFLEFNGGRQALGKI